MSAEPLKLPEPVLDTIAALWQDYSSVVLTKCTEQQLEQAQVTFYAGAFAAASLISLSFQTNNPNIRDQLTKDLDNFSEYVQKRAFEIMITEATK